MYTKIRKEVFWSLLAKAVAFGLYIITNVVLARKLGVDLFGQLSYFLAVLNIALVISLAGFNESSQKYVAQYKDTQKLRGILNGTLIGRIIISGVCVVIFFIFKKEILFYFSRQVPMPFFVIALPILFFGTILEWTKKIFNGLHRLKYVFYINFLEYGLKLIFTIILLYRSATIRSVIEAYILATIFGVCAGIFFLERNFISRISEQPCFVEKEVYKNILKYSIPLIVVNFGALLVSEIDIIMLGLLSSEQQIGYYSAAKQIVGKLPHISMAISMGIMPVFSVITKENVLAKEKMFAKALKVNGVLFGFIGLVILIGAPLIINVLFGKAYSSSIIIMQILMVSVVIFSFANYFAQLLFYQGKAVILGANLLLCTILNIVLNTILIPRFQGIGAAVATALAYLPYILINYFVVKDLFRRKKLNSF